MVNFYRRFWIPTPYREHYWDAAAWCYDHWAASFWRSSRVLQRNVPNRTKSRGGHRAALFTDQSLVVY